MLEFAVRYQPAIDDITGDKSANLRKYELSEEEWTIAMQLCDTLKVCDDVCMDLFTYQLAYLDIQGCDTFFLALYAQPCYGDPSNGSYR